jgi:hypothetical protein
MVARQLEADSRMWLTKRRKHARQHLASNELAASKPHTARVSCALGGAAGQPAEVLLAGNSRKTQEGMGLSLCAGYSLFFSRAARSAKALWVDFGPWGLAVEPSAKYCWSV